MSAEGFTEFQEIKDKVVKRSTTPILAPTASLDFPHSDLFINDEEHKIVIDNEKFAVAVYNANEAIRPSDRIKEVFVNPVPSLPALIESPDVVARDNGPALVSGNDVEVLAPLHTSNPDKSLMELSDIIEGNMNMRLRQGINEAIGREKYKRLMGRLQIAALGIGVFFGEALGFSTETGSEVVDNSLARGTVGAAVGALVLGGAVYVYKNIEQLENNSRMNFAKKAEERHKNGTEPGVDHVISIKPVEQQAA